MKIVLDLRIFGPQPGGLGRYNQKLLEELIILDKVNHYIILFKAKPDNLPALPSNFEIKIVNCHWYTLKEQIVIPWVLHKLKPDLVHFPHFNVPIFYRGTFVVTIHDLIMTKYPSRRASTHSALIFHFKYWLYHQIIRSAVHRAAKVIAVTNFGREDLIKYFKLDEQASKKIEMVYEGLSILNKNINHKLKLPEKYFLYVGNCYPHKNIDFLVRTFQKFSTKHPDYYLIIVGNRNYFYNRLERESAKIMGADINKLIFPGFVSDQDLSAYFQQAQAYVFPSLYEGFGLPPLEAMSFATPVISSNSSCLPEILGSSVLYFDPKNEDSLLAAWEKVVNDLGLRERLIALGYQQIAKYSWKDMAKKILAIYQSL